MPNAETVLIAGIPLYPLDTPLHVCQWLHTLTEQELTHWPRRNVSVTPLIYPAVPDPDTPGEVYAAFVCLN